MVDLPIAQPYLKGHAQEARQTNPPRVANTCGSKAEFSIYLRHVICDFRKRANIYKPTKQPFPKNDHANNVEVWNEIEQSMQR
jgi:hypothetical protein